MSAPKERKSLDLDDPIGLRIVWDRLIAIADRADVTLGRTAFSTVVRESHDYMCGLLDAQGNGLAQGSRSIPAFTGTLNRAAKAFLRRFPPETLRPGDVLLSNDPVIGTGHLPDMTLITPVFRHGRLVALAGSVAHMADIGGRSGAPDCRDNFEEGLRLPVVKFHVGGKVNRDVLDIVRFNVRMPDEVEGDLTGAVHANAVMARELLALMDEYGLDGLGELAAQIHSRSESALRRAIAAAPDGDYAGEITLDGFGDDVVLRARVSIRGDGVDVDFDGTTGQSPFGINVVPNYRYAMTSYALKCIFDPETPSNEGCLSPISDRAPEGSILNPRPDAAVHSRNLIGHAIPSLIFKILAPLVPGRVQGDSGGAPIWALNWSGTGDDGERRMAIQFLHGGQGGRAGLDGLDTLSFPSNCTTVSAEQLERAIPVLVECKELIPGSGGRGEYRGGLGQRVTFRNLSPRELRVHVKTEHVRHPCEGVLGGGPGRPGRVVLDGEPASGKATQVVAPGGRLTVETPGGGGWGAPERRPAALIENDRAQGLVDDIGARA